MIEYVTADGNLARNPPLLPKTADSLSGLQYSVSAGVCVLPGAKDCRRYGLDLLVSEKALREHFEESAVVLQDRAADPEMLFEIWNRKKILKYFN